MKVFGVVELGKRLVDLAIRKYPEKVLDFIDLTTLRIQVRAKALTPVRTGHLRRGWDNIEKAHLTATGVKAGIFNIVDYAPSIEYGRRIIRGGKTVGFTQGRFMLSQSLVKERAEMGRRWKAFLEELWRTAA
jgi:hypothetical protein